MEGARHVQLDDLLRAGLFRPFHPFPHPLEVAADDDLTRRVEVCRDADTATDGIAHGLGLLVSKTQKGGHGAGPLLTSFVHEFAAEPHGTERVLERERAGRHMRTELTE